MSASQLLEYAGDYYSDELRTTYTLVVKDEQLVAEHRKNEDIIMRPEEKDTFIARLFWKFGFTRNDEGTVTGFHASPGRVRNLRFYRQTC